MDNLRSMKLEQFLSDGLKWMEVWDKYSLNRRRCYWCSLGDRSLKPRGNNVFRGSTWLNAASLQPQLLCVLVNTLFLRSTVSLAA